MSSVNQSITLFFARISLNLIKVADKKLTVTETKTFQSDNSTKVIGELKIMMNRSSGNVNNKR